MKFQAALFLLPLVAVASVQAQPSWPGFPGLSDLINQIENRVSSLIGNLDNSLEKLFEGSGLQNFTKSVQEVANCYEAELGGQQFDIFNGSVSFKTIISQYYRALPNKTITRSSIESLLSSTRDIITKCLDPSKTDSAKYGYTEISDYSQEQLQALFGTRIPDEPESEKFTRRKRLSGSDSACQVSGSVPASFDWRSKNVVTSVKNQAQCGSCWTFATAGSIESALVKASKASLSVDLSEQQLVDCGKSGGDGCQGGNSQMGFSYVKSNGIASESADPYVARMQTCRSYTPAYRISDFCVRSKYRYTYSSLAENLSDDTIAKALVQNGPLYFTINANPLQNYRGGVLDTTSCSTSINHAVLLVGFDGPSNSWIIKNSWGTYWGEKGYFRVIRGKNMCGVNTEIAWPVL